MKNILLAITASSSFLISCAKPEVKDIQKGTTSVEVEKTFGKPSNRSELYGTDFWRYNDYVVVLTTGKVDTVIATDHLDKVTADLEKGFEEFSKALDSAVTVPQIDNQW